MDIFLDRMACSIIDYIGFCWWNKYMAWSCQSSYVWMISIFTRQQSINWNCRFEIWRMSHPHQSKCEASWTCGNFVHFLGFHVQVWSLVEQEICQLTVTRNENSWLFGNRQKWRSWTWFVFRYWQWRNINKSGDGAHILPGKIANNPPNF